jgi:hypothetical protein
MRLSPFDSWAFAAFDAQEWTIFSAATTMKLVVALTGLFRPILHIASPMCNWPRRSQSSDGWTKLGPPRKGSSNSVDSLGAE